jgi:hypothetical protein
MRRQRFPKIAASNNRVLTKMVLSIVRNSDPVLEQMGEQRIYEGEVMEASQRSDITVSDFQHVSSDFIFTHDMIRTTDLDAFVDEIDRGAFAMYESQQRTLFSQLSELTESAGQTVDAGGKLTWDAWMQTLEKLDLQFDERGDWIAPTLVIHPSNQADIERVFQEASADPRKRKQLEQLLQRRRRELYAKEANRDLAATEATRPTWSVRRQAESSPEGLHKQGNSRGP